MKDIISLNVTVDHKRFYNAESMYGVYGFIPNTELDKVNLDKGYLVVSGTTPELNVGSDYDIEIIPSSHPKYGDGYSFVAVKAKRPTTIKEQQEYLKLMVTPKQYEEIIKVYPNEPILDLMENDTFDYSEIKGIKEATYQRIKNNLFKNMEIQEALVELKDLQITFDAMKKLVNHFGSAQVVVKKVKNNIYSLCEVNMFGFKKVDEYAMKRGDDPTNQDRIVAAIYYILKQDANSGHSWMPKKELIKKLLKLLEIEEGYIEDTLQILKEKHADIYFNNNKVALEKNYFYESEIKNKLFSMLEAPCKTKHITMDDKIAEQERELGFNYTEEQKDAIQMAIENNVLVINGKGGTGKCISGDSLVFTDKGMIRIEDIPKHYTKTNDTLMADVISYDIKGARKIQKTSHWYNMGHSKTYKIKTSQGYEIEGTPEHPLLVINDKGQLIYKKLQDIKEEDVVSISKNNNLWAKGRRVSNNISYIMGVLTGDGSLTDKATKGKMITYTNANKNVYEHTNHLIEKEFDVEVRSRKSQSNSLNHTVWCPFMYDQLKKLGLSMDYSYNKSIPNSVLKSNKQVNIAFLQGLFDTDGYISAKRGFEYCTSSERLAKEVQMVLLNLGIVSKFNKKINKQKEYSHFGNEYYYIHVTGEDLDIMHENSLFRFNKKHKKTLEECIKVKRNTNKHVLYNTQELIKEFHKELLEEDWYNKKNIYKIKLKNGETTSCIQGSMDKRGRNISTKNLLMVFDSYSFKNKNTTYVKNIAKNIFFDKIVTIDESEGIVYDFTVPETHSFVANGIINHNTAIVKGVLSALSDYSYMGCSLSGKAAKVLSNQGVQAKTIHRMLGFDPETGGFIHNKNNPLPYDIVVLDETSMANNYLIYSIIVALKEDAKFIMVGDNGQLPSIGTGAVFDDLLTSNNRIPKKELTIVHRQAQKSGILSIANQIREGNQVNERDSYDVQVYGELKDMVTIPVDGDTDIKSMVLDICKKDVNRNLSDFQVLTGRVDSGNISVKSLNIEMQKIFNDVNKPFVKRGGYEYREGDKIIQNGNNYEALIEPKELSPYDFLDDNADAEEPKTTEVFNGTIGKIERIEFDSNKSKQEHKVYIKFEDIDDLVVYSVADLQQIDLAYAISTHKSQGSTIKNVLFAFDFASYMLLSREFVYTGITRASKGCILIAENDALHFAIDKTSGGNRRTFLKEMLGSKDK